MLGAAEKYKPSLLADVVTETPVWLFFRRNVVNSDSYLLPPLLEEFCERYPDVELLVETGHRL
ncbi:MAG: hypothetical protein ACREEM_05105 [Blastocatellia bacterium]